jgi:hypothetical protein
MRPLRLDGLRDRRDRRTGRRRPLGLLMARLAGSTLLLTAVVTLVGTAVSRWSYARVAQRGSRAID